MTEPDIDIDLGAPVLHRFTESDCWMLAIEINKITGWPMTAYYEVGSDQEVVWQHVLVQRPDGLYVDITGAHDQDEVFGRYEYGDDVEECWLDTVTAANLERPENLPIPDDVAGIAAMVLAAIREEETKFIPPCGDPDCDARCRQCDDELREDYLEQRADEEREERKLWPTASL